MIKLRKSLFGIHRLFLGRTKDDKNLEFSFFLDGVGVKYKALNHALFNKKISIQKKGASSTLTPF